MMEQKKTDKDVLIVRDEKTGEIGVVAGLNSDGTPKMKDAKPEHGADFLKFDRNSDVLDNFFKNFFRQCEDPKRFGFYRVAAEGVENLLEVMKELLKNPEQNKDLLAAHKVDTTVYEQQAKQEQESEQKPEAKEEQKSNEGYKPIDESRINWQEMEERWGVKRDALVESGSLEKMLHYGKSPKLIQCNPTIDGISFPLQARLSFKEQADGSIALVPHPIRHEAKLDEYRGVKFTAEDQESLKRTGNLGRVAEVVDKTTGEIIPSYISIDRQTNELVSIPVKNVRLPEEIKGVTLDKEQQAALAEGKGVYVEGMIAKTGKNFNATIQINADRQAMDFQFTGRKQEQKQGEQQQQANGQSTEKQPRQLRINGKLLGREVSPEEQARLKAGGTVYMEGLIDKKGQPFNAYVRPNFERGKYDFLKWNPDKSQAKEVTPDSASRTQVAVNSNGKTNEATKHIDAPLKKEQETPASTQQQEKQKKPKGMRV